MLKGVLALAAGWLALTGMQDSTVAAPANRAALELWRLDCGEFTFSDYNAFFSDTSEYPSGPKNLVGSCYLIRHGDSFMLWDAGIPAATVGQPIQTPAIRATLRATIVDQLARINVRPEQVTIIGISHYHFDHTGQAASFPHARLIMGAGDLAALRGTEPGVEREPLAPWLTGGGQVTEARGDHDVFGDGSVTVLNLPGHTPGHRGLLVRLASGPVLLSGDMYHFAEQVQRRGLPPFNTSRAETLASMDRFDRLGRNLRARVIIQHEPADVARLPAFPLAAR
jgi:N-acyl homoserine lactone hydrolase